MIFANLSVEGNAVSSDDFGPSSAGNLSTTIGKMARARPECRRRGICRLSGKYQRITGTMGLARFGDNQTHGEKIIRTEGIAALA